MTIIIKPTFNCNFRCSYCYLTHQVKSDNYMMPLSVAKGLVEKIVGLSNKWRKVTFIWHGGEPLLWGIENYKAIFEYTENFKDKVLFYHSIQTNLSLISDEYIELFKKYNVRIGFSLDGPKEINDRYRKRIDGSGSFDTIIRNLYKCREAGLHVGTIMVASSAFKNCIPDLYRFIVEHKLNFKFNPLFLSGEASNCQDLSLTPFEYAKMSNELFDLWFFDKENHIKESTFIDIASAFLTRNLRTNGCIFSMNCQNNFLAISPRGDVFPCGRFCDTDTKFSYGNINKEPLEIILKRRKESAQYKRAEYIAKSGCRKCEYYGLCHGGCLHDGFLRNGDFKSKTFLCSAYKQIFSHIERRLIESGLLKKEC
ncbi:MAG: radical SAM protein [Muribaculaceae bacterium]|nr:radical SAM protein [Muribaculaceae bacterium]